MGIIYKQKTSFMKNQNPQKNPNKAFYCKTIESPIGNLILVSSQRALVGVLWENEKPGRVHLAPLIEDKKNPVLIEAQRQLKEYFQGKRNSFDLPLDFVGTDFQKSVWKYLLKIPYGETRTYGQIAEMLGNPKASRAVGAANGKNPIAIIAACHRVIGVSGALTGFAGGIEAKATLLKLENKNSSLQDISRINKSTKFSMIC